jgi:uncharacterized protein YycO
MKRFFIKQSNALQPQREYRFKKHLRSLSIFGLMKNLFSNAAILFILAFFFSLSTNAQERAFYRQLELQTGDLLFFGAKTDQLSGAINRVTQRQEEVSFDHVGLLEISDSTIYILHASPADGSIREVLDSVLSRAGEKNKRMVVYRLSDDAQASIPTAIDRAETMLGKPYNWSYVLNDSSLYCSDFVERAFRDAALFSLEPMTFKDPKTGQTDSFWASYYKNLGMDVPEGQPGCNPNGLAANEHLKKIGDLEIN